MAKTGSRSRYVCHVPNHPGDSRGHIRPPILSLVHAPANLYLTAVLGDIDVTTH